MFVMANRKKHTRTWKGIDAFRHSVIHRRRGLFRPFVLWPYWPSEIPPTAG